MAEADKKKLKWRTEEAHISEMRPGAVPFQGGIRFSAAFQTDGEVILRLFHKGTDELIGEIPMPLQPGQGIWRSVKVFGIKASRIEYQYVVDGVIRQDPAAALLAGRSSFGNPDQPSGSRMHCRIPSDSFDWQDEGGPLQIPYEDVISYLLHVRGFTRQKGSKVRHPGTFKGVEEKIPYLKELGINQVILMPAYEFDEIVRPQKDYADTPYADPQAQPEAFRLNYWGYGPGWYYAPKASYAAGSRPDYEFKSMVRALHRAGIEVVMEFAFSDGTDIEFMAHCLTWWCHEYHVDGFVLLTGREAAQALASFPALRLTKLMGGGFDTAALYPHGRRISHRVAADYNDGFRNDMRQMLKGDAGMLRNFVNRTRANDRDKGVINYITGHDGFTLMDLVSYSQKYNEANGEGGRDGNADEFSWNCGAEGPTRKKAVQKLRMQQMKNAMTMLLLSQGTPVLLAGDEFGNTQNGNNNPWCQDNETTWLDWKSLKTNRELTDFVKKLIAFRKSHPVLHQAEPLTGADRASCGLPDFSCHSDSAWYCAYEPENRHVGLMYCGSGAREHSCVYAAYNFHWEEQEFAVPYLPEEYRWKLVFGTDPDSGDKAEKEPVYPVRSFRVPGRTIRVLESVKAEAASVNEKTAGETE